MKSIYVSLSIIAFIMLMDDLCASLPNSPDEEFQKIIGFQKVHIHLFKDSPLLFSHALPLDLELVQDYFYGISGELIKTASVNGQNSCVVEVNFSGILLAQIEYADKTRETIKVFEK